MSVVASFLGDVGTWLAILVLGFPIMMLLKVVGEWVGIAIGRALKPLFHVPRILRLIAVCAAIYIPWYWHPLPEWDWWWAGIALVFMLPFSLAMGRYRCLEGDLLFFVTNFYLIALIYSRVYEHVQGVVSSFLISSIAWAFPAYCLRSMGRAYGIEANVQAQRSRNVQARIVLKGIVEGRQIRPFSLYLRPFSTADRLGAHVQSRPSEWILGGGRFTSGRPAFFADMSDAIDLIADATVDDVENVLAQAAPRNLIAVGGEDDSIGAGRAPLLDGPWLDHVIKLMKGAESVFVVPLDGEGTIEEIRAIVAEGLLSKSVFLMPSEYRPSDYDGDPAKLLQSRWTRAKELLSGCVELPQYSPGGSIFMYVDGKVIQLTGAPWAAPGMLAVWKLWRSLRQLSLLKAGTQQR